MWFGSDSFIQFKPKQLIVEKEASSEEKVKRFLLNTLSAVTIFNKEYNGHLLMVMHFVGFSQIMVKIWPGFIHLFKKKKKRPV